MTAVNSRLRLIVGDVEALQRGQDPENTERLLRRIHLHATRALEDVNDLAQSVRQVSFQLHDGVGSS